jgi:hypothetical protein
MNISGNGILAFQTPAQLEANRTADYDIPVPSFRLGSPEIASAFLHNVFTSTATLWWAAAAFAIGFAGSGPLKPACRSPETVAAELKESGAAAWCPCTHRGRGGREP